jgi:hypothetical protein
VGGLLVIGAVEPRALEDDPGSGTDQSPDLALAFRAFGKRRGGHRLEDLENPAFFALIIVVRHYFSFT